MRYSIGVKPRAGGDADPRRDERESEPAHRVGGYLARQHQGLTAI